MKTFIVESPKFPGHEVPSYERLQLILENANFINKLAKVDALDVDITEREGKVYIETDSLDDLVKFSTVLGAVMALDEQQKEKEFIESFNDD